VRLTAADGEVFQGVVLQVLRSLPLNEPEVVVGLTNAGRRVEPGEFLTAQIEIPRDHAVLAIPGSAVLRAPEGSFVYVARDEAFRRTEVTTGSEAAGKVEITEGLSPDDTVVSTPVETLWLVELRATRGGGHSHAH
jgi:multidrug efflux pump subunit AcrA (membrane-fusion protein)